ncbi:PilZ domain-containing protein [Paenibacillus hexagrammi]|uniref:PilZ domain-containing protein n=1 Tax=Paenibacillus hexagrammi TaxID=2908839 RepID=A0ABY3SJ85_9BACL|nr:PilZ domain-containing protein [Paenibacillus sp. YPD9-1]UJF33294.1 PilZ domain-containing protein [Paenibacillus sp. YPD9-1]
MKYYGSKEGNDAEILIDSKAVLDKRDFVATGVITYVLGDIIEIELPQYNIFQLGDKIKVTIYTKSGLFVFDTSVVAKDHGSIIVINPPDNRKKFTEKREFPRIEIVKGGLLHGLHDIQRRKHQFERPVSINIKNISLSGVGFTVDDNIHLDTTAHLELELLLGFSISCLTEVVRRETQDTGIYYGARYINVPDAKTNALRAFILKNQVEAYFVQKKDVKMKKVTDMGSGVR